MSIFCSCSTTPQNTGVPTIQKVISTAVVLFAVPIKADDGTESRQTIPYDPPLHLHSRPFYRNVYEAIRFKRPVIVAPEQSRIYVAIAEAIARSSRTRECVVVP